MPEFLSAEEEAHAGRPGRRPVRRRAELLRATVVVLAGLALGALGGVVWELLWTPPTGAAWQGRWIPDPDGAARVVDATALFVFVGLAYGLVYGSIAALTARGHELVTLAAVLVGSLLAARVTLWVGRALGPADADGTAAGMEDLEPLRGSLELPAGSAPWWPEAFGSSALLAPAIAALGCLVVVWFAGSRRRASSSSQSSSKSQSSASASAAPDSSGHDSGS